MDLRGTTLPRVDYNARTPDEKKRCMEPREGDHFYTRMGGTRKQSNK